MLLGTNGVVRLATDVEIRYLNDGKPLGKFTVVSSDKYKTASGESKENSCFIDVVVWGRLSEICNQYLRKGSKIFISGDLKQDKWTTEKGEKRSKHTITVNKLEMLDSKPQAQQNNQDDPAQHQTPSQNQSAAVPEVDIDFDQIPFGYIPKRLAMVLL